MDLMLSQLQVWICIYLLHHFECYWRQTARVKAVASLPSGSAVIDGSRKNEIQCSLVGISTLNFVQYFDAVV